jgi:hypothetical protein
MPTLLAADYRKKANEREKLSDKPDHFTFMSPRESKQIMRSTFEGLSDLANLIEAKSKLR